MKNTTSAKGKSDMTVVTKPRAPLEYVDTCLNQVMYEYIDVAKLASRGEEQARSAKNLIQSYIYWVGSYIQFLAYNKEIGSYTNVENSTNIAKGFSLEKSGNAYPIGARLDVQRSLLKQIAATWYYDNGNADNADTDLNESFSKEEAEFMYTAVKNIGSIYPLLEKVISIIDGHATPVKETDGSTKIISEIGKLKRLTNSIR